MYIYDRLNGWLFNYAVPSDMKTMGNVEMQNINIVSRSSIFFFFTLRFQLKATQGKKFFPSPERSNYLWGPHTA